MRIVLLTATNGTGFGWIALTEASGRFIPVGEISLINVMFTGGYKPAARL